MRKIKTESKNTQDMMTLGSDDIPQPVHKKGGLRLKAKHHRRLVKGLAAASACAILVGGAFGINALFFNEAAPNTVQEGFSTVLYELPTDGSTPDLHSALENIGYMNARFRAQSVWYSEMAGTVDTMLSQQVNTWKQFSDGVLIQTDITTSSLINSAKQFCWVGDRVIWREAAGGPSTYNGINTAWKEGAPYGNMSVEEYKATRGLPGTEFSVYVINEETLLDASSVTDNGDGTYTQTYYLDPATDKAPAYYVNQMMFTGGLTSLPTFEYITVTYTFDATWQVLSSQIEEAYTATKGVNAKCTANYHTVYEYGTDRAYATAYEDYFKDYADKPATGAPEEEPLTAADCLAEAFGPVLSGPVNFALDLSLNGEPYEGLVCVDVSDMENIALRAQIGTVQLQYAGGQVYLRYGNGVKVRMSAEELAALISSLTGGEAAGDISFDTDVLLAQLGGGTFTLAEDGRSAALSSELTLMGMNIPVSFTFDVSEQGAVTLGGVSADIAVAGMQIGASLAYTEESIPALTEQEAAAYADLMPYVQTVLNIVSGDAISLGLSYSAQGISLTADLDVAIKGEFMVQGSLVLGYGTASKCVQLAYAGGFVYLTLDGIKLKADLGQAIELIGSYLTFPEVSLDGLQVDPGALINMILSPEFAANFAVTEGDNVLNIAVKGSELLSLFGVDFALGDVALGVQNGTVSASALGADIVVTAGQPFTVDTDGYTDGVKLVQNVLGLLTQDYLSAGVTYAAGDLSVIGTVMLDMNSFAAKAELALGYKSARKTVNILYADGSVYVELDGIKLKASLEELAALLSSVLGMDMNVATPEGDLLEQVLSLNFGEYLAISENDGAAEVLVKGTELLKVFGIDFALGDVQLSVTDGKITASALGADIVVTAGQPFTVDTNGYADIVPLVQNVLGLLSQDYLAADVTYAAGDLSVVGTVTLDMNSFAARAELALGYKTARKTVNILYADGSVYVELDGIRLTASVEELAALLSSVLGMDMNVATPEGDLLEQVLSLNFGEYLAISENDGAAEVLVKGTELLKVFGIDFALGDVQLSVTDGKITASALGADIVVTAGQPFTVDTNGYADIVPLVQNVLGLLSQDYLAADVTYAAGDLSVVGTVTLDMNSFAAKAELALGYKTARKTVNILYADGSVYVELDGIRLTASVEELAALLSSVLGMDMNVATPEGDLLEQVLSLDFGDYLAISENDGAAEVLVKGTELLKVFGIDFALGDVQLSVTDGKITAAALGADIVVTAGQPFAVDTNGYADIVPLVQNVLGLLTQDYLSAGVTYAAGDLSVIGTVTLDMNSFAARAELALGYKSARKTVNILYADGSVYVELDGIRLTASVEELAALLSSVLGMDMEVPTPEGDLLEQVLSLNFGDYLAISENDGAAEVLVKGTELLKVFGIDFALGDVQLSVSDGKITASALGADIVVTAGQPFTVDTDGYTDGVKLVQNVLGLLTQDYLSAGVTYAAGNLSVIGTVMLDMNSFAARAELALGYKSARKTVNILYADDCVYAEIDGIKIKASVEELVSLLSSVLGMDMNVATPEGDLLEQVLSLDFGDYLAISENDGAAEVLVKGTELLKVFGIDFALGDVQLSVSDGKITAAALGADIVVTAGQPFTVDTDGYTDGVKLVQNVLALLSQDYLSAGVTYAAGDLSVIGTVTLDMNSFAARAELALGYKSARKTVNILYADGSVYVELDGIKLKASLEELAALLSSVLGMDMNVATPEGDLLEQVLSLNFGEYLAISENDGVVEVLVKGTELLKVFGIDFALGDVQLSVSDGKITASALGADIVVTAGQPFAVDTNGYADAAPVLELLATVLKEERIALDGTLTVQYQRMKFLVSVENGVISWRDGFALAADLVITANGICQVISVDADTAYLRIVYGNVGVELKYDELYQLGNTFESVYTRIAAILNASLSGKQLPDTVNELAASLGAAAAVTNSLSAIDLPALLEGIVFGGATAEEGSIGTVSYSGFLFDLIADGGALSLSFGETALGGVTLAGSLAVSAAEGEPAANTQDGLMTVGDLCELLDFAGAAVATLASQDMTISFSGVTKDANGNDVFGISGALLYHSGLAGSGFPIVIDTEGKTITIDPGAYVCFSLVLDDRREGGTDLYLDFWMFDAGNDGELDFFVSISKYPGETYASDGETRLDQPLRFTVPASDILTILASGISLTEGKLSGFLTGFGLPADTVDALFSTLDAFFGSKWLTDTDKAQLGALGGVLMGTLGLDAALDEVLAGLNESVSGALDGAAAIDPGKYLTALGIKRSEDGKITFSVTLNSDLIYGGSKLAPLTISLTKTEGAEGSLLSGISLGNIWGNKNTENTGVDFAFSFGETVLDTGDPAGATLTAQDGSAYTLTYSDYANYTFEGADELIKTIAASATHLTEDGGYALNGSFVIEGSAAASLEVFGQDVELTGIGIQIGVRVSSAGEIVLNVRISYTKYSVLFIPVINSTGVTDLTIKDGLIYMRRTLEGEQPTYRVMSLANFANGLLTDHLCYMLNFSDAIQGIINSSSENQKPEDGGTDDYGIVLGKILNSYTYTARSEESGASWTLNFNGAAFTDNVLTDMIVTIGADRENVLRTLNLSTSLVELIDISAPLELKNPCDEEYPDPTQDVSELLTGADLLAALDWEAHKEENFYLSPQLTTVNYAVDGTPVRSQDVWYSGSELLTSLDVPSLEGYEREGYTLGWKQFSFSPNGTMEAVYSPKLYDVTIVAPANLGGNWTDNGDGTYSFATQMYYNETLTLTWGSNSQIFTVGLRDNVFDLGAAIGEDEVLWEEAAADILTGGSSVKVPLTPKYVIYTSSGVNFDINGGTTFVSEAQVEFDARCTLVTSPAAEGNYTFLGWYVWNGSALEQVTTLDYETCEQTTTVSALWVSNLTNGTITTSTSGSWFSYDHTISVSAAGGRLVGEYAHLFTVNASVDMTLKWNTVSYDIDFSNFAITQTDAGWQAGVATAHSLVSDPTVRVTMTVDVLLGTQSVGTASLSFSKKC